MWPNDFSESFDISEFRPFMSSNRHFSLSRPRSAPVGHVVPNSSSLLLYIVDNAGGEGIVIWNALEFLPRRSIWLCMSVANDIQSHTSDVMEANGSCKSTRKQPDISLFGRACSCRALWVCV